MVVKCGMFPDMMWIWATCRNVVIVGAVLSLGCRGEPQDQRQGDQEPAGNPLFDECTAGVADGDVTVDGRPLLWKLRNESDVTNDVHYFVSGVEHYPGYGASLFSYLGMGPAADTPDGPVRQGVNSKGLAIGWNVLGASGWKSLHHKALGFHGTVGQVRPYLNSTKDLTTYNYVVDATGEAALWESQKSPAEHWEYNTRDVDRDGQSIDADDADGDGDYSTGTDVTLSGFVVRANSPGHFNSDGTDDLANTGRYRIGRDVVGKLIYNGGGSSALSAKSLAKDFFRDDGLALSSTVSNMIVHGVLPTEDHRLTTMWTLLGHTETGIFVPVWLHGVESGGANKVPAYLDAGDDGISVYQPAKDMYYAVSGFAAVQSRTLPFEAHLFDVVTSTLLPEWRGQNWSDPGAVAAVGVQMKRVQERMDAEAYKHLKYLHDHGATSNHAPTVSIGPVTSKGLDVTLALVTDDADGATTIASTLCEYGDGSNGSSLTHTYSKGGRFLVSCTVTDAKGVSQTDWTFVTAAAMPDTCSDGVKNNGERRIDCGGPCGPCECLASSECDDSKPCTADSCSPTAGKCEYAPISGCCTSNSDCDDGDPSTADECDPVSHTCTNAPKSGDAGVPSADARPAGDAGVPLADAGPAGGDGSAASPDPDSDDSGCRVGRAREVPAGPVLLLLVACLFLFGRRPGRRSYG